MENSSNHGAQNLSLNFPQDHFVELCALSTTVELSPEERQLLDEHLASCAECRDLKSQYEAVVGQEIPALGFEYRSDNSSGEYQNRWSLEEAEASLMAALDREMARNDRPKREPVPTKKINLHSQTWRYAFAASLIGVCSLAAYQVGVSRNRMDRTTHAQLSDPSSSKPPTPISTNKEGEELNGRAEDEAILKALKRQLVDAKKEVGDLKQQQAKLEEELTNKDADLTRITQERTDLDNQLTQAQANLEGVQEKLSLLASQKSSEQTQTPVLESQLQDLQNQIQGKDSQIAQDRELLQHDRDIRNLISARDLYIAEIYDVGKKGETSKPFGRVFYTRGKSLVFYAYDLDQQPGLKRAAIFQAWGRRGADPKNDVNLGIFYEDDSTNKRWILKSSDPKTLAQIDAVFVTVETKPEPSKPSGKPLLFTYLRIPPNHP
jgi:Putative zinc-finger